jgi:hypothetical protein
MGLPCVYIIRDRIKANSTLLSEDFYIYWRLDRLATLISLNSALFLRDPVRIEARGKNKKKKKDTRELIRVEHARNATAITPRKERKL